MKNKEALLVEVNRIREMMGLNLIMEQGIGSLTKKILGVFGYTDEAMEAVAKNVDVDVIVKNGIDTLETKALQKGIDIANATEDQLLKLFDESPSLKNEIETLYRKATKDAADKIIANMPTGILGAEITNLITRATATKLHPSFAQIASDLYGDIGTKLDSVINQLQRQGTPVPKDLQELRDLVTLKQIEADEMVNFKRPTSVDSDALDPDALIPTSKPPLPESGLDDVEIDDLIKRFKSNPKKYPFFDNFLVTVRSLGFKKNIENILIADYAKYYEYTADQLIRLGNKTVKELNEKNWGWAKKMFRDVSTGKLKVKNVAGLLGLVVFLGVAIPWSLTGIETSEKVREQYSNWAELGGGSKEPTIEDATAWIGTLNGPGGDLEGLSVTGFAKDASGVENRYIATLSDNRSQKLLWDPNTKKFTPQ